MEVWSGVVAVARKHDINLFCFPGSIDSLWTRDITRVLFANGSVGRIGRFEETDLVQKRKGKLYGRLMS
jgi:hypothetical protein